MTFIKRISNAWSILLGKELEKPSLDSNEELLKLQTEIASVKLDLQESQDKLRQERSRIESIEKTQSDQVTQRIESQIEELFIQLAGPMSQLRMQASLLKNGIDVKGSDIMSVASNFTGMVEKAGLEPVGETGNVIKFDPEIAQSLSAGSNITAGDEVVVKIIGYRYKGRIIRKALVEKVN